MNSHIIACGFTSTSARKGRHTGQIRSVLVDFDGTACAVDVASAVCEQFAGEGWQMFDDAVARRELTLRAAIDAQARTLSAGREHMLAWVLEHFVVDPTFVDFAAWAHTHDMHVAVVSDGFGFYIGPMLAAAGLEQLPVLANRLTGERGALRLEHPFGHPECVACGTCKMRAVLDARTRGAVAFVGEGESDRFAALFADVTFAKDKLAILCAEAGIGYAPWTDFGDVRAGIAATTGWAAEAATAGPDDDAPAGATSTAAGGRDAAAQTPPCPGWTVDTTTGREVRP